MWWFAVLVLIFFDWISPRSSLPWTLSSAPWTVPGWTQGIFPEGGSQWPHGTKKKSCSKPQKCLKMDILRKNWVGLIGLRLPRWNLILGSLSLFNHFRVVHHRETLAFNTKAKCFWSKCQQFCTVDTMFVGRKASFCQREYFAVWKVPIKNIYWMFCLFPTKQESTWKFVGWKFMVKSKPQIRKQSWGLWTTIVV